MTRSKLTLGIDEAGRGPVLGQMVLAAVCLDTKSARALTRAGLADSKSYGAGKKAKRIRAELAAEVRMVAQHVAVAVVDVSIIDRRVRRSELNLLEREIATELIDRAPSCERIVADGRRMFAPLRDTFGHLEAHDDGESKHASVAAASVIAKTRRDELMERICARYRSEFGDITGGGYVNAGTKRFLRAYAERYGTLPPEARRSWPYQYLEDILGQGFDAFADCPEEQQGQLGLF